MKSRCHFAVGLFACDKIDKMCLEYVPPEEDRSDNNVNNIAVMATSELFQDWIAKTIVLCFGLLDSDASCDGNYCFL